MSSENLVLGLALLLTVVGVAGLVPGFVEGFRRRRLLAQLANLDLEDASGDEAEEAALEPEDDEYDVLQRRMQTMMPRGNREAPPAAHVAQPAPAQRAEAVPPALRPLDVVEEALDDEAPLLTVEDDAEDEEGFETEAAQEATTAEAVDDDLLAMFRETKARSAAPEALADAIEPVAASDLLAQARELRDMLRRAA